VFERLYPKFVSMLGAAGLACALAYFVGIYLAFQPEWEQWAEFFVPAAVPLLVIPWVLLLAYLYLRTHLGQWFLRRGRLDDAVAYCEERLEPNLERSQKEALINRITLARAHVARADYESADELLATGFVMPDKGAQALDICRWRMEIALRVEDLVRCHRAFEQADGIARPKSARAYLRACRAELAARENDRVGFDDAVDKALWDRPKNARARLAQVLGVLRFGASADEFEEALALLEEVVGPTLADVPHREGELIALRAELSLELGRQADACEALELADQARADTRANYEIRRVRERISDPSGTDCNQT
jgi:tetratricopeptide (TPR) repeat protein